jgi:hypothetical protein
MTPTARDIGTLVVRIQDDLLAAPLVTLTPEDAVRRFGAEQAMCEGVLDLLVDAGVLARCRDGVHARSPRGVRAA